MPFLGKQPTAGFSTIVKDDLTADGSTTAFTLSKNVASANDIAVFVGNVRQEPTDAYTVSGTTLTMSAAPSAAINFYVLHIAGVVESSVVPAAGTTVPGAFGVSGDLTVDTNTLYVNSTNNRVGIGTTSPSAPLHIQKTGADAGILVEETSITGYSQYLQLKDSTTSWYVVNRYASGGAGNSGFGIGTTASGDYLQIDTSGRVLMPSQPMFTAYRGSYSLPTQAWTQIVYDNCTLNRGSGYSTSTGRFTAPVAGYYYFEAIGEGGGNAFHTLISVNGATPTGHGDTAQNWTSSNVSRQALVVSLNTNDYVTVSHYIDSGKTMTNNRSHFHGWLIG